MSGAWLGARASKMREDRQLILMTPDPLTRSRKHAIAERADIPLLDLVARRSYRAGSPPVSLMLGMPAARTAVATRRRSSPASSAPAAVATASAGRTAEEARPAAARVHRNPELGEATSLTDIADRPV